MLLFHLCYYFTFALIITGSETQNWRGSQFLRNHDLLIRCLLPVQWLLVWTIGGVIYFVWGSTRHSIHDNNCSNIQSRTRRRKTWTKVGDHNFWKIMINYVQQLSYQKQFVRIIEGGWGDWVYHAWGRKIHKMFSKANTKCSIQFMIQDEKRTERGCFFLVFFCFSVFFFFFFFFFFLKNKLG